MAGERSLMQNAARIVEEVTAALDNLSGERGAEAGLAGALKKLSRMNPEARRIASTAETALEQAYASAEEARRELEALLSRLDSDTGALEKRKSGCSRSGRWRASMA